jgi:thiopurine S-methyltransferase
LSALAVDQLFDELALEPEKTACGDLYRYSAKGVDVFVGDIFKLSRVALEKVDVVYDRAALVALPEEIRGRYAAHLIEITHAAPQFLICYEYDQSLMEGPPFSIGGDELNRRYGKTYDLTLIENADAPGGLKGECAAKETAWSLKKK